MSPAFAAAALAGLLVACKQPVVGAASAAQESRGPEIAIVDASVDPTSHVVVRFAIGLDGSPIAAADAVALRPTFTLAFLSTHPVDGLDAWESLLPTGRQTSLSLPPGGPGTPPALVLADVKQPGTESSGTLADVGGGEFTYTFATALPPGFDLASTVRVGVYLGAAEGTPRTSATHDFVPAGGTPRSRETVLDANCNPCHGTVRAHGGRRTGVRLCLTCHTWQNADPDTVDPAAMDGSTAATDPNPLEFGRLVHRIHRGKNLPTLYQASSTAAAPALPSPTALPLPFFPGRNTGIVGRKFAVVGYMSAEHVFGRVESRTENGQPARTLASGVAFPRDLRDCAVCHRDAPEESEIVDAISRRTCHGCHPEIWFEPSSISDAVHFAHPGGPQSDDTECAGCHVAATPTQPKVYAPIAEAHVPPVKSPRYSKPTIEIVSVSGMVPGGAPTVVFKLYDRVGVLSPPNAPTPANDTAFPTSPVPRRIESLRISLMGSTTPDYLGTPIASADAGNPSLLTLVADPVTDEFTYTFASTLPATASGTWAVAMEARRRGSPGLYDTATDTFLWPYTGETVTESPDNPVIYVDVSTGSWPGGAPVPRRKVVSQQKCEACHLRFEKHGAQRHEVEYCIVCHVTDRTDWRYRPKGASGDVNLSATFDGIEERSSHLKVLLHRIHTGDRAGNAALDLVSPHVVYSFAPNFRDRARFPNDLRNCTLCHEGQTYLVDSVPADASPTIANETATLRHLGTSDHGASEAGTPPIQAACTGCHATSWARTHAQRHTVSGAERCAQCHVRGAYGVEEAHGLVTPSRSSVSSSFSSIAENILVPRCASAACHGGNPPAYYPQLDAAVAHDALVGRPSLQASMPLVDPGSPGTSYLLLKLRNEAGTVGGVPTPMPIGDVLLDPGEIAAIEAWVAAGAPND